MPFFEQKFKNRKWLYGDEVNDGIKEMIKGCRFGNSVVFIDSFCLEVLLKSVGDKKSESTLALMKRLGIDLLKILTCKVILVCINAEEHWSLLAIFTQTQTAYLYDSIRSWRHLKIAIDVAKILSSRNITFIETFNPTEEYIPKQTGGWECGYYTLDFANLILKKTAPSSITESDVITLK